MPPIALASAQHRVGLHQVPIPSGCELRNRPNQCELLSIRSAVEAFVRCRSLSQFRAGRWDRLQESCCVPSPPSPLSCVPPPIASGLQRSGPLATVDLVSRSAERSVLP